MIRHLSAQVYHMANSFTKMGEQHVDKYSLFISKQVILFRLMNMPENNTLPFFITMIIYIYSLSAQF